jgi:cytochrome bd-type quinol oxidase subunit 2
MRYLLHLAVLLLPLMVYVLYIRFVRRRQETEPTWRETPWLWLMAAGLVLLTLSFLALGLVGGNPPGGVYVPPHVEDGKLVPGQVRK